MASIVLSAVGNALLPGVGGAVLGTLGKFAGGLLDQQLGLGGTRKFVGPRLENLKVQDSRYGAGIPLLFGRIRVAGQVIWSSGLSETAHEDNVGGGGKGGGGGGVSTLRYTYSVDCAVAIGQGPLSRLASVWADGKQLYDGLVWKSGLAASMSFYPGDAAQDADPVLQAALGMDNVPAYRGIAYLVFAQLQLADFGNRLPNLTFEVVANNAAANPVLGSNTLPLLDSSGTAYPTSGGTPPLVIGGTPRDVRQVLVAGMQNALAAGSTAAFSAVTYDVNGAQPQEIARIVSSAFTLDASLSNLCWAMSPDGRYVAMLATSTAASMQATLILYDVGSRQFGGAYQVAVKNFARSLVWLDALHCAFADHDGSVLGLRVFARRGLEPVPIGLFPVWGAGSATTRLPIGTAHFIALQGGVLMLAGNATGGLSTIYGCYVYWDDNRLIAGTPYTVAGGVPPFSLNRADIIPCGNGEYLFVFRRVDRVVLCSFVPSATGTVQTRPWQTIMLYVTSDDTGVCWLGAHLVVLQRLGYETQYRLSEITLQPTNFALAANGVVVGGEAAAGGIYYQPFPLDYNRMLVQGGDAFALDFNELRMLTRYAGGDTLENIAAAILAASGYDPADYTLAPLADTSIAGYSLQPPVTGRAALEPLRQFGAFDLIESDDRLKAVLRHAVPDAAVPDPELRATRDAAKIPPALVTARAPELALPRTLTVDYLDPAQDFEIGSQQASRIVTAAAARAKLNLPLACSADQARQVAEAQLYAAWAEREQGTFALSRRYLMLDPGDVVSVAGRDLRLQRLQQSGGLLQCDAVTNFVPPALAASATDAPPARALVDLAPLAGTMYLCDLPPLTSDADQPGLYAALSAPSGWPTGALYRSADGVSYTLQQNVSLPAIAGLAVTQLPAGPPDYPDNNSVVEVQLLQGTLASCTALELLNGANAALLGGEIIQFQTATLLGDGYYRLSNFLRGRRGTESALGAHAVGERFLLLESAKLHLLPLTLSDRNRTYYYKGATLGQDLAAIPARAVTVTLRTLQPLAPAQLQGTRAAGSGSDLTLSWLRRARRDNEWLDNLDVPLDETAELYDLEIYDTSNNLKRTVGGLTAPNYTYTAAQQSADFTVIPASYSVRVYQLSARYGRGVAAVATI